MCWGTEFIPQLFLLYTLMSRQFWTTAGEQNLFLCSSFSTYWWPASSEHVLGNRIYSFALRSLHIDFQTFLNNCWETEFILLLFLHYTLMTRQFWTCARDLELNSLLFLHYILMTGKFWTCAGKQKFNPQLFLHYSLISRQFLTCAGNRNLILSSSFTTNWCLDSS